MKGLIFLLSASLVLAHAADLHERYHEAKQQLEKDQANQRQVLGTLYSINKKMKQMSRKRDQLTDRMLATKGDVKSLAKSIVEYENLTHAQRKQLSRRLTTLYKMNSQVALRLVFGSTNLNNLNRNIKFLKVLSQHDYKMIKDYEQNIRHLRAHREKLAHKVQKLAAIQSDLKKQEDLLTEQQKSKSGLLEILSTRQQKTIAQISQMKRKDMSLMPLTSFFERKGELNPIVSGQLAQDFGMIEDPEYKSRLSHKGHFYRATPGQLVRAPHNGRVVFSGHLPGYGHTILLDHGDHYRTIYSHLTHVKVRVDDEIQENQPLAQVGFSPQQNTHGVYFEIRHFSDAIDPAAWMKDNQSKKVQQASNR